MRTKSAHQSCIQIEELNGVQFLLSEDIYHVCFWAKEWEAAKANLSGGVQQILVKPATVSLLSLCKQVLVGLRRLCMTIPTWFPIHFNAFRDRTFWMRFSKLTALS